MTARPSSVLLGPLLVLFGPLLVLFGPLDAQAQEGSGQTETNFLLKSTARWQQDNGDRTTPDNPNYNPTGENFGDLLTTFGGTVRHQEFLATLMVDSALYVHRPQAGEGASALISRELEDRYRNTVNLNFASLTYAHRDMDLTLGDFYMTLGRGLILAVRKTDAVGVDNKLRGADAEFRMGAVTLGAFGGFLDIKNFERGTGYAFDDTHDFIGGGRIQFRHQKFFKVGVHAMAIKPKDTDDESSRTFGVGAFVALPRPASWISLYLEAGAIDRNRERLSVTTERNGYGVYGNLNLYFKDVTILVEGKHYDDLFSLLPGGRTDSERQNINRLAEPPTAEHPGTLLLSNQAVTGGRLRLDYAFSTAFTPFVSLGRYRDRYLGGLVDSDITAVAAGADFHWDGTKLAAEGTYRGQFVSASRPGLSSVLREEVRATADFSQRLSRTYSAEVFFTGLRTEERAGSGLTSWLEGRFSVSLKSRDGWSALGAYEFYTKSPDAFRQHYFSLGGQWTFSERGTLRALGGGERAGLKCSGGVCRFFPGFEGVRLELELQL